MKKELPRRRVVCSEDRERVWGLDWFELLVVGAQEEWVGRELDAEPLLLTFCGTGA